MTSLSPNFSVLRLPQVKAKIGVSRSTIYALVKSGELKPPISIGARAVGWLSTDNEDFIKSRIPASCFREEL